MSFISDNRGSTAASPCSLRSKCFRFFGNACSRKYRCCNPDAGRDKLRFPYTVAGTSVVAVPEHYIFIPVCILVVDSANRTRKRCGSGRQQVALPIVASCGNDIDTGLRIVVVSPNGGRLITARTHPGLLGLQASLTDEGGININRISWDSAAARSLVSEAAGEEVRLVNLGDDVGRFDVLPLLVATDGVIQDLDLDGRRLRPNIVIGGVPGQTERSWPGRLLRIRCVEIRVAQLRMRCVMTTFHPDTLEQNPNVLKGIVKKAGGRTALDCSVISPGLICVNDPATVSHSAASLK